MLCLNTLIYWTREQIGCFSNKPTFNRLGNPLYKFDTRYLFCILWKNFGENQNALCLETESGLKKQTSKNDQDREVRRHFGNGDWQHLSNWPNVLFKKREPVMVEGLFFLVYGGGRRQGAAARSTNLQKIVQ